MARRGKRPSLIFAFDPDSESFSCVGEEGEEYRDYLAEIAELLGGDDYWRTPREIAAPVEKGGIGASFDTVKGELERNPDRFISRTGYAAKEVGRSAQATVWQLRTDQSHEVTTDQAEVERLADRGEAA